MALTQIQIIQSLGEAMNWLERELSWGVAIQEQRHLVGRIGELYAALMTGGQMAQETNQAGYDVVSSRDEKISVKTTTQEGSSGHLAFSANTLHHVDRVMVFFLNTEEMQIDTLLDCSKDEAMAMFSNDSVGGKLILPLGRLRGAARVPVRQLEDQKVKAEQSFGDLKIRELESGTILVVDAGGIIPVTKPVLRDIATKLGVALLGGNGVPLTTRQLGTRIIKELAESRGG